MSEAAQRTTQELRTAALTIVGRSEQARLMRRFAEAAAATEHTILLRGETGAGKDHLAEIIHGMGRSKKNLVPVDCGALTDSLSETELFGHTRGAFTDAREVKEGLLQTAENGTIFFNEVANMSLGLQAKFLRILDKRSFRMVGGVREYPVNTRIIAATNADLEKAVEKGELRSDLYHRLNGITHKVAPLRERREDVRMLVEHFLQTEDLRFIFSASALKMLEEYHWPGNVRELKAVVVKTSFDAMLKGEEVVDEAMVKPHLSGALSNSAREVPPSYRQMKREYFQRVITYAGGQVRRAARIAGISWKAMDYNLTLYQLDHLRNNRSQ